MNAQDLISRRHAIPKTISVAAGLAALVTPVISGCGGTADVVKTGLRSEVTGIRLNYRAADCFGVMDELKTFTLESDEDCSALVKLDLKSDGKNIFEEQFDLSAGNKTGEIVIDGTFMITDVEATIVKVGKDGKISMDKFVVNEGPESNSPECATETE